MSSPSAPGASSPASASSPGTSGSAIGSPAGSEYCVQHGGEVQTRTPYWGTNGDQSSWLPLGGTTTACRFQANDEAKSRIYVDLTTLSSPKPTLAALAYLSKVPMPSGVGGNPATGYCSTELGGSSTFGSIGAAGGGWVATEDPDDVVVALCVFPDLSYIDEWGLAYHSNGDIRGADLQPLMAYQPGGVLPPVFTGGSTGSGATSVTPTS